MQPFFNIILADISKSSHSKDDIKNFGLADSSTSRRSFLHNQTINGFMKDYAQDIPLFFFFFF
jgi:hypothetical protein